MVIGSFFPVESNNFSFFKMDLSQIEDNFSSGVSETWLFPSEALSSNDLKTSDLIIAMPWWCLFSVFKCYTIIRHALTIVLTV